MITARYILSPLVGGVIGYLTNDIAIKMLFRPRRAVYIWKFRVPFTPGLIPQQKERIARSVGRTVSRELLNAETLKKTVLSEKVIAALRGRLEQKLTSMSEDERTVRALLLRRYPEERIEETKGRICEQATSFLMGKLSEMHVGRLLADAVMEELEKTMPLVMPLLGLVAEPLRNTIEQLVEEKVGEKAPELLEAELDKTAEEILAWRLRDIYERYRDRVPALLDWLEGVYREVMEVNLEKALGALDIERVITEKVGSLEAEQLEAMVLGIMKRELRAIVYLGGLLGFLIGFVNILF